MKFSSYFLINVIYVFLCLFELAPAPTPPLEGPALRRKNRESLLKQINAACQKSPDKCKKKQPRASKIKEAVRSQLIKDGRKPNEADEALRLTHAAKKALYKANGLQNIEPADTGLWADDILLNAKQAQYLINFYTTLNNQDAPAAALPPNPTTSGQQTGKGKGRPRGRRSHGMRPEKFPIQQWDLPIKVFIDNKKYTTDDQADVRKGLDLISSSTCIKFNFLENLPESGDFMHITPGDVYYSSICGFAVLGKQSGASIVTVYPYNSCKPILPGVIAHEVMHSLGFHHEHLRYDRDKYINITVDPTSAYYIDNLMAMYPQEYTSYGTKYDFGSVMHYPFYTGIFTMAPGYEQHASETGQCYLKSCLSEGDIDALNIAYCSPPECTDKYDDCGWWGSLNDFCQRTDITPKMSCPRTCQLCK